MVSWNIVFAMGAAQAALLALALWRRAVNPKANQILALWIALIGVDLAVKALYWDSPGPGLLKAFRLVGLFPFLYGSLFFVYVKALTAPASLRWRDTVHLAGFAIVVVMHAGFFMQSTAQTEQLFAQLRAGTATPAWPRLDIALYVYSLSYVIAGLVQVWRYRRRLHQQRADADRMSLRWVDAMAISQIVIWTIATLHWLIRLPWINYSLIYGAVAAWVFVVGYLSLQQGAVLASPALQAEPEPAAASAGSTPDAEDPRFPAVEARLSELMRQHHLYREPALTIGQLAKRSGYPEYLVSQLINRRFGENFWEYINRQRIDAASQCLADASDARTILEIADACGFTSKSTFNAAFKRQMGQTPSAYRKDQRTDAAPASSSS